MERIYKRLGITEAAWQEWESTGSGNVDNIIRTMIGEEAYAFLYKYGNDPDRIRNIGPKYAVAEFVKAVCWGSPSSYNIIRRPIFEKAMRIMAEESL